jgi:methionyl aminopeptidase
LSALFKELIPMVQPGVRLIDLDSFCHDYIVKAGAKPAFLHYDGYPASLCASINEVVIHGIPKDQVLKSGDVVGLDCGTNLDGFFSDAAVTVPVGEVSPEVSKLLKVTRECLDLGIAQAVAGNRIHHISRAVYDHAHENGFGVVDQYCGHGVGFAPHEDPSVPNYVGMGANPRLQPGMVIAIEPMINLGGPGVHVLKDDWTVVTNDHKVSAHYEHTVAILEDRTEVLTSWSL